MVWKGVIIEESLKDDSLLDLVEVVKSEKVGLEKTGDVKIFHSYKLKDSKKEEFVQEGMENLKEGWYCHLVKGDKIVVIYKGKCFEFKKGEKRKLEKAKQYGLSHGIPREQMPFEDLIENPHS